MEYQEHLKHFEQIKESTEGSFQRTQQVPPHIIRVCEDRVDLIFIAQMANQAEKDIVARLMKQLIRDGAEAVCFCCEAWSVEGQSKENYDKMMQQYEMPSCHPDRIEIVMLQYSWAGGEFWATTPIVRQEYDPWDEDADPKDFVDRPPELAEWRVIDSTTEEGKMTKEGRFTNLWQTAWDDDAEEPIDIRCVNMRELEELTQDGNYDSFSLDDLDQIWHKGFPPFDDDE